MKCTKPFRIQEEYHYGIMPLTGYWLYHIQIRTIFIWGTIATYCKVEDASNMVVTLMKSQL